MTILIGALTAIALIEGVILAVFYKTILNLMDSNYLLLQRAMNAEKVLNDINSDQEKARQILAEFLGKKAEQGNVKVTQLISSDKIN